MSATPVASASRRLPDRATPPPDIDIEAWQASLNLIEDWQPVTLFLTHFGPVLDPARISRAIVRCWPMRRPWWPGPSPLAGRTRIVSLSS